MGLPRGGGGAILAMLPVLSRQLPALIPLRGVDGDGGVRGVDGDGGGRGWEQSSSNLRSPFVSSVPTIGVCGSISGASSPLSTDTFMIGGQGVCGPNSRGLKIRRTQGITRDTDCVRAYVCKGLCISMPTKSYVFWVAVSCVRDCVRDCVRGYVLGKMCVHERRGSTVR